MGNLYELSRELRDIVDVLENDYESLEQHEIDNIMDTLSIKGDEINTKIDNYAKVLNRMSNNVRLLGDEIKRLQEKKKYIEKNQDRLKESLITGLSNIGVSKYKTDTVSVRVSETDKVEILDENEVPMDFKTETLSIKVDKQKIKSALKLGSTAIKGAVLVKSKYVVIK